MGEITRRLTILVDHGERASGVPARLQRLGADVDYRDLRTGDYVVAAVGVERKSFEDLHRSIASGRIWRQVGSLRNAFVRGYLVLEGKQLYDGPIGGRGVRGALLAIADGGVCPVWSRGPDDTAQWLWSIASRAREREPLRRRRAPSAASPEAFLATIPGVSPRIAIELIRRFGSVTGVGGASADELQDIAGIGASRAAAIKQVLA
jgi:ERCC4-type nuclease